MELGTGIFLSTLAIAVVLLYGITKDRWKWRRFVKRTTLVCLILILAGASVGGGVYLYHQMPIPVAQQTDYARLRLGMSQDEVLYIMGYPAFVLAEDISDPRWKGFHIVIETSKLEKGKSVRDYQDWSYGGYHHNINVGFENSVVTAIQCYSKDKLGRCPSVAGVQDGDTEARVRRVFGGNPEAKITGTAKSLLYPEWGVRLHLAKEQVYMLEIKAPGSFRR